MKRLVGRTNETIQDFVDALNKTLKEWKDLEEDLVNSLLKKYVNDPKVIILEENFIPFADYPNREKGARLLTEDALVDKVQEEVAESKACATLIKEIEKNVCPLFKKDKIIEALDLHDQKYRLIGFSKPKNKTLIIARGMLRGLLGPLLPILDVLNDDDERIKKCEQCSQFMVARGKTKRFCSEACQKKNFPQKPYDSGRKNYLKDYQKLFRSYDGPMAEWPEAERIEFKKKYPDKVKDKKRKGKNHGKKAKSK